MTKYKDYIGKIYADKETDTNAIKERIEEFANIKIPENEMVIKFECYHSDYPYLNSHNRGEFLLSIEISTVHTDDDFCKIKKDECKVKKYYGDIAPKDFIYLFRSVEFYLEHRGIAGL